MADRSLETARQMAGDFLAANPGMHIAVVRHGGVRLVADRSGTEHVSASARPCATCEHDPAVCEDGSACQITGEALQ